MFDPRATPPALLQPGDQVVFEQVDALPPPPPAPPGPGAGQPVLRIVAAGPYTTVQGGPRYGLSSSGVPAGGAMDLSALAQVNALLGNAPLTPGLEFTLAGPTVEALVPLRVALAGGARELRAGERLKIPALQAGLRGYLAVSGGLREPLPGEVLRPLRAGEELPLSSEPPRHALRPPPPPAPRERIRALRGPQWDWFSHPQAFFEDEYVLSPQSDRRGLRLQGPPLAHAGSANIPPEGTAPGAVQVPGDGLPIVLGPDRPVTGGYPKIATVIWADLPLLAQARPGARIRFQQVGIEEALAARRGAG